MVRSVWKPPYFSLPLLKAIQKDISKKGVKTCARNSTIIPAFIGARLFVHTGNQYVELQVKEDMVGKKLGYFVPSKMPWVFRQSNKRRKR